MPGLSHDKLGRSNLFLGAALIPTSPRQRCPHTVIYRSISGPSPGLGLFGHHVHALRTAAGTAHSLSSGSSCFAEEHHQFFHRHQERRGVPASAAETCEQHTLPCLPLTSLPALCFPIP